jgi:hypothetical protein
VHSPFSGTLRCILCCCRVPAALAKTSPTAAAATHSSLPRPSLASRALRPTLQKPARQSARRAPPPPPPRLRLAGSERRRRRAAAARRRPGRSCEILQSPHYRHSRRHSAVGPTVARAFGPLRACAPWAKGNAARACAVPAASKSKVSGKRTRASILSSSHVCTGHQRSALQPCYTGATRAVRGRIGGCTRVGGCTRGARGWAGVRGVYEGCTRDVQYDIAAMRRSQLLISILTEKTQQTTQRK